MWLKNMGCITSVLMWWCRAPGRVAGVDDGREVTGGQPDKDPKLHGNLLLNPRQEGQVFFSLLRAGNEAACVEPSGRAMITMRVCLNPYRVLSLPIKRELDHLEERFHRDPLTD